MITIDGAIKHCEEVAEENIKQAKHCSIFGDKQVGLECVECAKEHRQLAEWLRELKELREFARYVASSITAEEEEFDENPKFFGEVYCRKLHKLGIIKKVDNKWIYDKEAQDADSN